MQRSSTAKNVCRRLIGLRNPIQSVKPQGCEVFISHRRIDTKRNVAGLLYGHLSMLNLDPFLDSRNMKPGDNLFEKIDAAIRNCKVGVAVFSPRYCESYFCLQELSRIMEYGKKVVPIFCDVKPSKLKVKINGRCLAKELRRFNWALEKAKYTVGLTFDSSKGDWSELLASASEAVMKNLAEVEGEQIGQNQKDLSSMMDHQ